jgi:hypothetical protein
MNTKGLAHAIKGIELELENLKRHAGLPMDTGEEESYEEPEEELTKVVGRGRKQRTVPTLGDGSLGKKPKDEDED